MTFIFRLLMFVGASAFLIQCKPNTKTERSGVSEHGFRYTFASKNNGPKAKEGDLILVENGGWVGDLELFSSAKKYGEPFVHTIPLRSDIQAKPPNIARELWPMYDCLTMMSEGDSVFVYLPLDSNLKAGLPPNADPNAKDMKLLMHLVKITSEEAEQKRKEAESIQNTASSRRITTELPNVIKAFQDGELDDEIIKTPSGASVYFKKRTNGPKIGLQDRVKAHFVGMLMDGTVFEDTYSNNSSYSFSAGMGKMIKGVDEGILEMHKGSQAAIFIPANLGYGAAGQAKAQIPPNADLVFFIEVL